MAYAGVSVLSKPSVFHRGLMNQGAVPHREDGAVVADEGVVTFDPSQMDLNRYYCVELDGEPILYRRVSDREVEVYGLAPD